MGSSNLTGVKAAKESRAPVPAEKRATGRTIIVAVLVAVIIGATAGTAIYRYRVIPFRITVLEVGGTSINMRYFLKRIAMSGKLPISMLLLLTEEQIIKQTVTRPPYNITFQDQDIDQFARDLARGKGETIKEAEFREWYRQKLNESHLSDVEFRELLKTMLLMQKMSKYLGERVPIVAEQVFLNMIPVKDSGVGAEVKKKYDAGEDFAALARKYSVDPKLKDNGGKVGWFPRGVLAAGSDSAAFELEVGKISDPFYIDEHTPVVIMISKKVAARKIDEQSLRVLRSKALDEWYKKEYANHEVKFHGFHDGYDSKTDAWVQRQLMRMRSGRPESENSR